MDQEEMREISREEKEEERPQEEAAKEEVPRKKDPERRQQKLDLNYEVTIEDKQEKPNDNNLTISTKLSTDRLICKTPKTSPNSSVKKEKLIKKKSGQINCRNLELYLGVLQILFGILMTVFGVLAIMHKAALSQIGGGIWGGCLAISSGTVGLLTAAKSCCPLKKRAYDIAQTVFLALSLITVAVSQLVLVLAATGLSRDVQKQNSQPNETDSEILIENLPSEKAVLGNIALILTSALQFITSTLTCYKIARSICPCFKKDDEQMQQDYNNSAKQAFINSWLGKQNSTPFYVVAAPSTLGKGSKLSSGLSVTPIYTIPPQSVQPRSVIGYPLIPAPLGSVPSPMIRQPHKEYIYAQPIYHHSKELALTEKQKKRQRGRSRSKSKEKTVTSEDLAKTYTGLDRVIAEEFIDICESRNNSLCSSDSSCQSCCQCSSQNVCSLCSSSGSSGSEGNSQDYLVNAQ